MPFGDPVGYQIGAGPGQAFLQGRAAQFDINRLMALLPLQAQSIQESIAASRAGRDRAGQMLPYEITTAKHRAALLKAQAEAEQGLADVMARVTRAQDADRGRQEREREEAEAAAAEALAAASPEAVAQALTQGGQGPLQAPLYIRQQSEPDPLRHTGRIEDPIDMLGAMGLGVARGARGAGRFLGGALTPGMPSNVARQGPGPASTILPPPSLPPGVGGESDLIRRLEGLVSDRNAGVPQYEMEAIEQYVLQALLERDRP